MASSYTSLTVAPFSFSSYFRRILDLFSLSLDGRDLGLLLVTTSPVSKSISQWAQVKIAGNSSNKCLCAYLKSLLDSNKPHIELYPLLFLLSYHIYCKRKDCSLLNSKICCEVTIIISDVVFLLKFPRSRRVTKDLSYLSNPAAGAWLLYYISRQLKFISSITY